LRLLIEAPGDLTPERLAEAIGDAGAPVLAASEVGSHAERFAVASRESA
jgi:hypothetical protein